MPPAWQVRDAEQQEFVQAFARRVYDVADGLPTNSIRFFVEFGIGLLRHIGGQPQEIHSPHYDFAVAEGMVQEFLAEARAFARVDSEVNALVSRMFREVKGSIFSDATSKYEMDRLRDPQHTLHASSATVEVEFAAG